MFANIAIVGQGIFGMKILFMEWKSFGNEDILSAFQKMGHTVKRCPFSNKELRSNETVEKEILSAIQTFSPDFVFSFNYFPIISLACKKADMRYLAWVYDSPYVMLYSYTIIYPGNYVFVFDKELCSEFCKAGIKTVHYLPMAANTDRLRGMNDETLFSSTRWKNQKDLAFIGSLYTEKHQFFSRLEGITEYTRGYLEGLMAAQKQVYGYNFIKESLTKEIVEDMHRILPMQPDPTGVESMEYLFAQYVINRELTARERQEILKKVSETHGLDLYTPDETFAMSGCVNHGPVDYYDMAPYVFRHAKINLNISLRSIKSGMPLRVFDIMGSGGFLLTNFQADFLDYFTPGEDYDYYESVGDLMQKIDYYLAHEEERKAIARNGFEKIAAGHTYEHRIAEMFSYL